MLQGNTLTCIWRTVRRTPLQPTRRCLSKVQIIHTTSPSIFTTSTMDPDLQLSRWGAASKTLFGSHTNYLHPGELKYQFPTDGAPEFAFVGRSNVGKSSLVDLLLGSKKMVHVSKEPGCTRTINYYGLRKDNKASNYLAYFVDLPGYGFARKSKDEQKKWTEIIHSRVFILVDARRGLQDSDLQMMITLNEAFIPYQIVLTKVDLISTAELFITVKAAFDVILSKHGGTCMPFVHAISTLKGTGIDALKLSIAEIYSHKFSSGDKDGGSEASGFV